MEFPKRRGRSSWYELSSGETVQGKEEALAAEAALQGDGGGGVAAGGLPRLSSVGEGEQRRPVVELLQAACRIMWGLTTAEDGWFGVDTERKVREVQQRAGLDVTGEVDGDTWGVLLAGPE